MANDNMQNSLLEKLHANQSSGGEYAEPNYVRYIYSFILLMILFMNDNPIKYASI